MPQAKFLLAIILFACLYVHTIVAHSWVACTDYRMANQQDSEVYDPSKCKAFPRNWMSVASDLGVDRGFNFQGDETNTCRDPVQTAPGYGYTDQYPMAQYAPGQQVCLAWPTKNHVAATCTNPYIPDQGVKIFASGPNPTQNPTQSQFKNFVVDDAVNGVHQNGVIDFKGFQNCPRFCDNMDKSLCTGCFTVPNNLQVGAVYSFQWYWIFNAGSAPYTTCWEAKIISGTGSGTSTTTTSSSSSSSSTTTTTTTTTTTSSSGTSSDGTSGTSDSGSTSTSSSSGGKTDIIILADIPSVIPYDGSFTIDVSYVVSDSRQIVVQIVDTQGNEYAKGLASVTGRGTVTIKVTIFNPPTIGTQVILRASIVPQGYANDPSNYAIDTAQSDVVVGDSLFPDTTGANTTATASNNCNSVAPIGLLSGVAALLGITLW